MRLLLTPSVQHFRVQITEWTYGTKSKSHQSTFAITIKDKFSPADFYQIKETGNLDLGVGASICL